MSIYQEALAIGGKRHKGEDSTCKVSWWHIPVGTDYHHARVIEMYFADSSVAEKFATKYDAPPVLAVFMPLAT
jgi:hypothetical protein